MLQELLNQLLCGTERLWPVVKPIYEELVKKQRTKFPSWDVDTLQSALISVSELRYFDLGILVFLDALDEHDGDNERLTRLVWKLVQNSAGSRLKFKICLASRPWPVFASSFSSCSSFAIQDHTRDDIHIYTKRKLREATTGLSVPEENKVYFSKVHDISEQVTDKARGVFTWARLVVDELAKGLKDGTPLSVLEQKLSEMPTELKDLYVHTLRRIEVEYQSETWIMLQVALCCISPLPLKTFLACSSFARWDNEHEFDTKDSMIRHLASRSGGLLETISVPKTPAKGDTHTVSVTSTLSYDSHDSIVKVQFKHQTVKDFVALGKFSSEFSNATFTTSSGYLYLLKYGVRFGALLKDEVTRNMFKYAKAIEKNSPQELEQTKFILNRIWTCPPPQSQRSIVRADGFGFGDWIELFIANSHVRSYYTRTLNQLRARKAFLCLAIGANLLEYVHGMFGVDDEDAADDTILWLHLAISAPSLVEGQEDRLAMVKVLLNHGVSANEEVYKSHLFTLRNSHTLLIARKNAITPMKYPVLTLILSGSYELAEEDRYAMVRKILQHGATPHVSVRLGTEPYDVSSDIQEYSAMQYAAHYESADMIKLLRRHGAAYGFSGDFRHSISPTIALVALLRKDNEVRKALRPYCTLYKQETEQPPYAMDALVMSSLFGAFAI
ncbi:hypothetical protein MMC34_003767 [Xylographa carneopallida]|nr:hypothetical protein [Xylographa carneopallida]